MHVPRKEPAEQSAPAGPLPDSLRLRREAMLAVKAANDQWEASNRPTHDAVWFRRNVLPGLQKGILS